MTRENIKYSSNLIIGLPVKLDMEKEPLVEEAPVPEAVDHAVIAVCGIIKIRI